MLPSEYIEKGWVQGVLARNSYGAETSILDKDACGWCVSGAIAAYHRRITLEIDSSNSLEIRSYDAEIQYISHVLDRIDAPNLPLWNDDTNRTKEEILQVLREVEQELGLVKENVAE